MEKRKTLLTLPGMILLLLYHCAHSLVTIKSELSSPNFCRNQLCIMMELLTGHCHLKGHLFKMSLENSPKCNRCSQASGTTSHIHCDCQALDILRLRHLGGLFMQPGDSEEISVRRIHTLCNVGGWVGGHQMHEHKICYGHCSVSFLYFVLLYSIIFYSIPLYSTFGTLFQEWGS
jgi:hypothetical protein